MNEIIESADYNKAVALHRRICANAQAAQESLWEVCRGLKEMHDTKLFKELGYSSFEEYTEKEVGIKRHQAQKYLAVAGLENGDTYHHLGLSKLALLAKLDEPQREEIQHSVNVEEVSVRELKAKIEDLKKANDRLMGKVDEAEKKAADSRKSEETACGKLSILRTDSEMKDQKIIQLEKQIEELESRPIEVAVEKDIAAVEDIKKESEKRLNKLRTEHEHELEILKAEYENRLKEASAKKEEVIDTKAVFKAYLSIAIDASKRLVEFINNNPDELFISRTKSLFEAIIKEVKA